MNQEFLQLKREVEELRAWKKSLEASHSIPLNIHQSFTERFVKNIGNLIPTGTGAAGSTQLYNSFDVIVPANPSGVLNVTFNGSTYGLLFK